MPGSLKNKIERRFDRAMRDVVRFLRENCDDQFMEYQIADALNLRERDVANALAFACRCDEVDYKTSTINGDLHRRWFAVATPTWNPKLQKRLNWII